MRRTGTLAITTRKTGADTDVCISGPGNDGDTEIVGFLNAQAAASWALELREAAESIDPIEQQYKDRIGDLQHEVAQLKALVSEIARCDSALEYIKQCNECLSDEIESIATEQLIAAVTNEWSKA